MHGISIADILGLYMYHFKFPADGSRMSYCYGMSSTKGSLQEGHLFPVHTKALYELVVALFSSHSPPACVGLLGWGVAIQSGGTPGTW